MRQIKKEKGLTYPLIAEAAGVPLRTVQKIFNGETDRPRYTTVMAIEKAFFDLGAAEGKKPNFGYLVSDENRQPGLVREKSAYHAKRQGEYTVDDFNALPEGVRVELIDGVFYDMGEPTGVHQLIAGEVYRQIANWLIEKEGPCQVYIAPRGVRLDRDEKTMVEPDVLIICDPHRDRRREIYGAPDFVLEVISPSTGKKDYTLKLHKYQEAGVKELWIVDPAKAYVIVYHFDSDDCTQIYGIGEGTDVEIPVGIYGGELVISFKRIAAWIQKDREEEEREMREQEHREE